MTQFLLATTLSNVAPASLAEALALVEQRLEAWSSNSSDYDSLLAEVFSKAGTDPGLRQQVADELRSTLLSRGLGIGMERLSDDQLPGLNGADSANAPGGVERIHRKATWLPTATAAQIEAADTTAPVATTTTPAYAAAATNPFGLANVGTFASPSLVDMDGDGDLDAYIGERFGNTLFFRNTAAAGSSNPAFAGPTTNPFGLADVGNFASPSFIDIDGDDDLDALIGNGDGNTLFFRNTAAAGSSNPAFAAATTNPFGLADVGSIASPSFVDIDGDGDLDALIGNSDGNTLLLRNTAAAGSSSPAFAAPSTNPFGLADVGIAASPRFADVDGDGDLDALIGNSDGNTLFFHNTAAAGSSPAYNAPTINPFALEDVGSVNCPSFIDIDGDGDHDALIGNRDGNARFFRNTAPALGLGSTTANDTYGMGSQIILTLTFSEAVFVDSTGGTPSLQLETGSVDRFALYASGNGTNTLSFTYTVQAGDRSPDLDLLSADALALNGGTISDAAGNDAVLTLAAPGSPASLATRKNLVVDGIAPVAFTSAPAYAAPTTNPFGLEKGNFSASPCFVDIDGDGDLDAFIGNEVGTTYDPIGNIRFFRNTAAAGSSSPAFAAPTTNPFGLTEVGGIAMPSFVDIDADGDLDAVIGNRAGNTVFFRNTAAAGSTSPAFAAASTNPFGLSGVGSYASPSFVDVDGDGDLDAFIGNKDGNTLFFRNTAAPGSTSPAFAAPSTNPFGLVDVSDFARPSLVDIDGDGDLDAFIGELYGNTLFFRNTAASGSSNPAFAAPSTNPFGLADVSNWASPSLTDIDGDGDLDAFIGQFEGNTLFFRNTAPALGVSSSTANGSYGAGAVINLTVSFSEAVLVSGSPRLQLETGLNDRFAIYSGGSGTSTLSFAYTVQPGDNAADLDVLNGAALALNGGTIKDAAGNNAVLSLAAPGSPASLAARRNLVIIDDIPAEIIAGPTLIGSSGISVTSNEAGTAALVKADNSRLFVTAVSANVAATLTLAAQATVTSAILVVADGAGNLTAPAPRFWLGTTGADAISGTIGADLLYGFGGNDSLVGAAGMDTLIGGNGGDTYTIETLGDLVVETNAVAATGGIDTVLSSLAAYVLTANVENLRLTGVAAINGIGNGLANVIIGNTAANSLSGGGGNDTLIGGAGNDSYLFDADTALGSDTLNEAGGGIDSLNFSATTNMAISLKLGLATSQVINANLSLTLGSGATFENVIGGGLSDSIVANSLANSLTGGGGNDTLIGGAGNDSYLFDADAALGSDTLNEAGGGIDSLSFAATSIRAISLNLSLAGSQAVNANLSLTLGSGATFENVIGGSLADTLIGNGLANSLNGGGGNDTLTGGLGADRFRFAAALNASSNRDVITDFSLAQGDQIELENAVFTALSTTGPLAASAFFIGAAATSSTQRILYNSATGALAYDSDGNGAAAAVAFATLSPGLALSSSSFSVT